MQKKMKYTAEKEKFKNLLKEELKTTIIYYFWDIRYLYSENTYKVQTRSTKY